MGPKLIVGIPDMQIKKDFRQWRRRVITKRGQRQKSVDRSRSSSAKNTDIGGPQNCYDRVEGRVKFWWT